MKDDFNPKNDDALRDYLRNGIEWHPSEFTYLDKYIRGLLAQTEEAVATWFDEGVPAGFTVETWLTVFREQNPILKRVEDDDESDS